MSEQTELGSFLDLLWCIAVRVSSSGKVVPLNAAAARLLDALPKRDQALQVLFGLDPSDHPPKQLRSRGRIEHAMAAGTGVAKPLRWDVLDSDDEDSCICVCVDWEPLQPILDHIRQQSLQFKEVVLNILPKNIVRDLTEKDAVRPRAFRRTSIFFTDVADFAKIARSLDPVSLIRKLNFYFSLQDEVIESLGLAKIKTIGDAYMCASGMPHRRPSHAVDAVLALFSIRRKLSESRGRPQMVDDVDVANWTFRFGVHSGPCIAGIVGRTRHIFDIWGDAVNVAARVEEAGEPNDITVSEATYKLVKPYFDCRESATIDVRHSGPVKTYVVEGLSSHLAEDAHGTMPNKSFVDSYCRAFYPDLQGEPATTVPQLLRLVEPRTSAPPDSIPPTS